MTVTLHWWYGPILLAFIGSVIGSRQRDWDFVTPIFALIFFACALTWCLVRCFS